MSKSSLALLVSIVAACGSSVPSAAGPPVTRPAAMRSYVFVLLHRGPAWTAEQTAESKQTFEGHMANINAMARSGKLVLAGPFETPATDERGLAGIFIFDATTIDEVKPLLANDPAITTGRLTPEFTEWYGPVGLTYDGKPGR